MKNSKNQFKNNEQYLIEDIIKNGKGSRTWYDLALQEMVEYNIQDVHLTEEVYNALMKYSTPKVNHSTKNKGEKHSCPNCGSKKASLAKTYVAPSGTKTRLMICDDKSCETNFTISDTNYKKHYGE